MLNALTIDVEDYFHVSNFSSLVSFDDWTALESRVVENTRRTLRLLEKYDVRATFFVLGWVAEYHPEIVLEIHKDGHEVACHGYSHRLAYEMTPEEFRADVLRAKGLLERLIGEPVRGFRAASFSLTPETPWGPEILREAGFEYDSSMFPIRHHRYGNSNGQRFPHVIETKEGPLVEFPLTTFRLLGQNLPFAGGGYLRLLPYTVIHRAISHVNRVEKQPVILYLHPWEFDPDQPRIPASALSRFRHYHNLHRTEEKLRKLLEEFQFAPVAEVLACNGFDIVQRD